MARDFDEGYLMAITDELVKAGLDDAAALNKELEEQTR